VNTGLSEHAFLPWDEAGEMDWRLIALLAPPAKLQQWRLVLDMSVP